MQSTAKFCNIIDSDKILLFNDFPELSIDVNPQAIKQVIVRQHSLDNKHVYCNCFTRSAGAVVRIPATWQEYQQIRQQRGDGSIPRIKYCHGEVLLMSPIVICKSV